MSQAVRLVTSIPGPKAKAIIARREVAVPRGAAKLFPIVAESAHGALLIDVDGNTFIDFSGGIGVLNIGHTHEEITAAIKVQVDKFTHTCFYVAMYEDYVKLAEELARLTPGNFPKKSFLLNTGSEAVENAVKIARRYTGRPAVVAFENAFHGRTLLGMTLSAKASQKYGCGPFAPEVYRAPFPNLYRSPFATEEEAVNWAFDSFRRLIEQEISPDRVAAVVLEPVQGESGFLVTPPAFMRRVVEFCRKHGILFIADEIQTFSRTGAWFAMEHYGVDADLYTVAKSLGAGLPMAAVIGRAEVMDAPEAGVLGGTYGGNPVACAGSLKTIEVMERDDYNRKAVELGNRVMIRFRQFQRKYSLVGDVRGLGAMLALELVNDRITKEPAAVKAAAIFKRCAENGLILMKAGSHNNIIRFLAPVMIEPNHLEEGLDILEQALEAESPVLDKTGTAE